MNEYIRRWSKSQESKVGTKLPLSTSLPTPSISFPLVVKVVAIMPGKQSNSSQSSSGSGQGGYNVTSTGTNSQVCARCSVDASDADSGPMRCFAGEPLLPPRLWIVGAEPKLVPLQQR